MKKLKEESWVERARSRYGMMIVLILLLPIAVDAAESVVFDGSAEEPFQLLVGDKKGWTIPVGDAEVSSNAGYLTVGPGNGAGAKLATWSGKGEAQLYLAAAEPQDFSDLLAQDAALVTLLQVHAPPKKKVTLRMGCGYPCSANADISKLLKALPTDQWLRVSFDLKCFADGGLDIANVDTPFLLLTKGRLSLSVSDVRLVPGAGPAATINCR
jgi:beta-glucosidase